MESFLRWAGSKRQLVNKLAAYWPGGDRRYIEPFCGSACLFFHLEPTDAVLGDINSELVTAMRAVQYDVSLVVECLTRLVRGRTAYYRIRAEDPTRLSICEQAARFIYLNHYCFNGLYRTNKAGRFNVPHGRSRTDSPVNVELLVKASTVLQNASLVASDFENTLDWARPGDFVYMDPPYVVRRRRVFSEYGPGSFANQDLQRLGDLMRELDKRGVMFLVTYADSAEARRLFRPWGAVRLRTRRNIAGFAGARRHAYEVLATNVS